jgi:hypothetical protein
VRECPPVSPDGRDQLAGPYSVVPMTQIGFPPPSVESTSPSRPRTEPSGVTISRRPLRTSAEKPRGQTSGHGCPSLTRTNATLCAARSQVIRIGPSKEAGHAHSAPDGSGSAGGAVASGISTASDGSGYAVRAGHGTVAVQPATRTATREASLRRRSIRIVALVRPLLMRTKIRAPVVNQRAAMSPGRAPRAARLLSAPCETSSRDGGDNEQKDDRPAEYEKAIERCVAPEGPSHITGRVGQRMQKTIQGRVMRNALTANLAMTRQPDSDAACSRHRALALWSRRAMVISNGCHAWECHPWRRDRAPWSAAVTTPRWSSVRVRDRTPC